MNYLYDVHRSRLFDLLRLALCWITITGSVVGGDLTPSHRAMFVGETCQIQAQVTRRTFSLHFGELVRIVSVDDETCLVANPRFQAHVPSKSLVDLGDVGLLATIDAAECSAAERQYAEGNFFRHRDLSRAARCFEAAIAEDPQLGMALVDLIELRRTQQDQGSVTKSIDKLRSYAEFKEIVLAEDFVMNATQEVVMRCETVRRDSAYLSRAMAEHLYQLGRERPNFLVSAGRMAKAACEMIPSSTENKLLLAKIHVAASQHLPADEATQILSDAFRLVGEAIELAPYDWRPYFFQAVLLDMAGQDEVALAQADAAVKRNPRCVQAHRLIADIYIRNSEQKRSSSQGKTFDLSRWERAPAIAAGMDLIAGLHVPLVAAGESSSLYALHGNAPAPAETLRNDQGSTLLHCLVESNNPLCLGFIGQHWSVDWQAVDSSGQPALAKAIRLGRTDCVFTLLQFGADPAWSQPGEVDSISIAEQLGRYDLLFVIARSDRISEDTKTRLMQLDETQQKKSFPECKNRLKQLAISHLDNEILSKSDRLLSQIAALERRKAQVDREHRESASTVPEYVRMAPVMLPEGYDSDMRSNPVRANLRLMRLMQENVDEMMELQNEQTAQLQQEADALEQQLENARTAVRQQATSFLIDAFMVLGQHEYPAYCDLASRKLQRQLAIHSVSWEPPSLGR